MSSNNYDILPKSNLQYFLNKLKDYIPQEIDDLEDIVISNISNGQILKWNATTSRYENADESGGVPTFIGTKAQWEALTAQEKAQYDGGSVIITDDYDSGAGIDYSTTALDKVWSSSKVSTELSGKADTSDLPILTSEVTALTGATSVTITDSRIHTTSKLIEPKASVQGLAQPTMTITEGQCLLEFPALAQDTSFGLLIYN